MDKEIQQLLNNAYAYFIEQNNNVLQIDASKFMDALKKAYYGKGNKDFNDGHCSFCGTTIQVVYNASNTAFNENFFVRNVLIHKYHPEKKHSDTYFVNDHQKSIENIPTKDENIDMLKAELEKANQKIELLQSTLRNIDLTMINTIATIEEALS